MCSAQLLISFCFAYRVVPGRSNDGGAAAVDAEVGAVDVAGQWASHEGDQVGHFLRSAKAAGRVVEDVSEDAGLDRWPVLCPAPVGRLAAVEGLHAGRDDDARADRVDRYAAAVQVLG